MLMDGCICSVCECAQLSGQHTFVSCLFFFFLFPQTLLNVRLVHVFLKDPYFVSLVVHEYKHDSDSRDSQAALFGAVPHHRPPPRLPPRLLLSFRRSPAKEALMGVWRPVSRSVGYVYFPPRVSRALGGRVSPPPPLAASPPPGRGVPCGSAGSTST